jgi:phosphoglycerate dehydrogenase-like enzyme
MRTQVALEGPLRVLVGKERFSENHAWSEMSQYWPACLAGRTVIEVVGQGQLEARLVDGGPPVDVVVPLWSPVPGARNPGRESFGLVQQFGVGVENIDLDVAADEGVWVANVPGLNAVPVAEHAITLLLAPARRLPEALDAQRREMLMAAATRATGSPASMRRHVRSRPSTDMGALR